MKPTKDLLLLAAALTVSALLADAWRSARQDSQRLAATLSAQNNLIQQATARETQRDSQLSGALATIQSQKRAIQTPHQAAQQLASILPALPLPVSIAEPAPSAPLPPGETPSTTITVPQPDLVPLYDDLQDCRASAAQSDALKKDLSDEKSRSTSLAKERDAAIAAARGGTFLVRLKRSAKWFAIGVATGAAIAAATAARAHH
jgi:hypothetical protein